MKSILIILLIILAIFAVIFLKPTSGKAARQTSTQTEQTLDSPTPEDLVETTAPKTPEPQRPATTATTIAEEVNSVVNYGTGASQLKAKKNATQKIRNIQNQHNKNLEKALK